MSQQVSMSRTMTETVYACYVICLKLMHHGNQPRLGHGKHTAPHTNSWWGKLAEHHTAPPAGKQPIQDPAY
jgi:methanogenic corrinoid protein MtbC1